MSVFLLSDKIAFPPPHLADENGLLAVGGDLTQKRLLLAYSMGIFPWFSDELILWWSPNPRLVLFPDEFKISKSLRKIIRKKVFHVTMDTAFKRVINSCAQTRLNNNEQTWIVNDMIDAYCKLHEVGFAHSVEAWHDGRLAGGLYGVALGKCFFGESMFTNVSNASKVALAILVKYLKTLSFDMIDCQVTTKHLISLGAREISRKIFIKRLNLSIKTPIKSNQWVF